MTHETPMPEDRMYDERRDGALLAEVGGASVGPDSQAAGLKDHEPLLDQDLSADRDGDRDVLGEPDALGNDHDVLGASTASTDADALTDRDVLADPGTTDASTRTDASAGMDASTRTDHTTRADSTTGTEGDREPLVRPELAMDLRTRWDIVQRSFVDDPRNAVTDADSLVGEVMQRLSDSLAEQLRRLESEWHDGEPSTEDLRTALKRYRTFFNRLLEV